jgi:hypothetical protein
MLKQTVLVTFSLIITSIALAGCAGSPAAPAKPQAVPPRSTGDRLDLVRRLAAEAIEADSNFLGKPRWVVNDSTQRVRIDLSPVAPEALLSGDDPLAPPLELMIRVMALRRDFKASWKGEPEWAGPLDDAEALVREYLNKLPPGASRRRDDRTSRLNEDAQRSWQKLKPLVDAYADRIGYDVETIRSPAEGYNVTIVISPPTGRVRFMPELAYRKAIYYGNLSDHWVKLDDGKQTLAGLFRYHAEWPSDLGGDEEGTFEIREVTTVTFRPKKQKR